MNNIWKSQEGIAVNAAHITGVHQSRITLALSGLRIFAVATLLLCVFCSETDAADGLSMVSFSTGLQISGPAQESGLQLRFSAKGTETVSATNTHDFTCQGVPYLTIPMADGGEVIAVTLKGPSFANFNNYCGQLPKALDVGPPACYDVFTNGVDCPGGHILFDSIDNAFLIELRPKSRLFTFDVPRRNSHYVIPADGHSQATPSTPGFSPADFTWTKVSGPPGSKVDTARGIVTAGTTPGTVRLKAEKAGGVCYTDSVDLEECDTCLNGDCKGPGGVKAMNRSVDVRIALGWSNTGDSAGFLNIKEVSPTPLLSTPASLRYEFARSDVEVIMANGGIRQVRAPDCFVNVLTNSASLYTNYFYRKSSISTNFNGVYTLTGSPFASVSVELLNGGSTNLQIIAQRDLDTMTVVSETNRYNWNGTGWELVSGGGLRQEIRTLASSGDFGTNTTVVRPEGGTTNVYKIVETFSTNTTHGWWRLVEQVVGTAGVPLVNKFYYYTNGLLLTADRSDGTWEYFTYDSIGRPSNVFSGFLASGITSNLLNCRLITNDYSSTLVSTDDDSTTDINRPRLSVERVLGQEVGRRYFFAFGNTNIEIVCPTIGAAWNDPGNLITTHTFFTNGLHFRELMRTQRPDGTMDLFSYSTFETNSTNIVLTGHPSDDSATDIDLGTKTVSIFEKGNLVSRTVSDVNGTNITISHEAYQYDSYNRLTNTIYFDGTKAAIAYACCGARVETDRDGSETSYGYDALKRRVTTTRSSITYSNTFDAYGNVLSVTRYGSDGTAMPISSATFDDSGRQTSSTDAMGNLTRYTNYFSSGLSVLKTTYPNLSERVETYYRDGSLSRVEGNTTFASRYEYAPTTTGLITRQIKMDNTNDLNEVITNFVDASSRPIKTQYADGAKQETFYNSKGQVERQVDPAGVTTIFTNNLIGEVTHTVIDLNGNGKMDLSVDRITGTLRDVVSVNNSAVFRSRSYVWLTDSNSTPTLVAETQQSTNGLRTTSWQLGPGGTLAISNVSEIAFGTGGARYITNTAPDGTRIVQSFQNGRIISVETFNPQLGSLGAVTYGYDAHGRQNTVTDARAGTITYTFNASDQIKSITTPSPTQVTSNLYDNMGRLNVAIQPDGRGVTNIYHLNGLLATNLGARVYPVTYTYDGQGRLLTMTTWTNYPSLGAATTSWNYDSYRGFLTSKMYAGNTNRIDYGYTNSGLMLWRAWSRGAITSYGYTAVGDLATIGYSDGTSPVTNRYTRSGRLSEAWSGTNKTAFTYADSGQLLVEASLLGGSTNVWDSLGRRQSIRLGLNLTVVTNTFNYDAASRLASVDFGVNHTGYSYLSNSALVGGLMFTNGNDLRLTVSNRYDNLSRLTTKDSRTNGGSLTRFNYGYNTANQRTANTNADSSYWVYQYDNLGQVISSKRYWADGFLVAGQQWEYNYDDIGNLRFTRSGGDPYGANLRQENYTANSLNQYSSRTVQGYLEVQGSVATNANVSVNETLAIRRGEYYRAEPYFNNTTAALWASVTNAALMPGATFDVATNTVSSLLLLKTPQSFSYDADGNLTNDGRFVWRWDAENRLTGLDSVTNSTPSNSWTKLRCGYDPQSRRVSKAVSNWVGNAWSNVLTLRFAYDGWNLIGEYDNTNSSSPVLLRSYVWGNDLSDTRQGAGGVGGLISMTVHTGPLTGVYFYCYDGNGNVMALINAADGIETARYEYGPFGTLVRATGPLAFVNPFRFSTEYHDDETGLIYYGYRFYSPTLGRWPSRDPLDEPGFGLLLRRKANGISDDVNLYAFVHNNPATQIDPFGLNAEETAAILQASLGAFRSLCGKKKHCDCPEWGNVKVVITLGLTSYEGCVSQSEAARDALKKLPFIDQFRSSYTMTWHYEWGGLGPSDHVGPHNWISLNPNSFDLATDPAFIIDLQQGWIRVIYMDYSYNIRLKCEPLSITTEYVPRN